MLSAIRVARLIKGYSQTDLANIVGVTPGAISQWEQGKTKPNIRKLKPLADALGISVAEIVEDRLDRWKVG